MSLLRDVADAVLDRRVPIRLRTGEERRVSARLALLECEAGAELLDWSKPTCSLLLRENERIRREELKRMRDELVTADEPPRVMFGSLREVFGWAQREGTGTRFPQ